MGELFDRLRALPRARRRRILEQCSPRELTALYYEWAFWARVDQLPPPGKWFTWLILSGFGAGKTRTGAEFMRWRVESGQCRHGLVVGRTLGEAKGLMVEGESGILAVSPPWNRPHYNKTDLTLTYDSGAKIIIRGADEPESIRGPSVDTGWGDELAAWQHPTEAYKNFKSRLRLGDPRNVITTTPQRMKILRTIRDSPTTVTTSVSTLANVVLPEQYRLEMAAAANTLQGRMEVGGELLDDDDFGEAMFNVGRLRREVACDVGRFVRIIVAVDPAVSKGRSSDETGIIVAAIDEDGTMWLLEDLSGRHGAERWIPIVLSAYERWSADAVVAEINRGGDLVEAAIRATLRAREGSDEAVTIKLVRASKGKRARSEVLALLVNRRRVVLVGPEEKWQKLEGELNDFEPEVEPSPNRVDAATWAAHDLAGKKDGAGTYGGIGAGQPGLPRRELPTNIEDPQPGEQDEYAQAYGEGGGGGAGWSEAGHRFL